MSQNKISVLFVLKVPPPVHGSTLMNSYVRDSQRIKNEFNTFYCCQSISKNGDIGSVSFKKLIRVIRNYINLIRITKRANPKLTYFALSPFGIAFLKDFISVTIIKIFSNARIVFHLHGKGISLQAEKSKLFKVLYENLFRDQFIIHLSDQLMYDVQPYKWNAAFIVPNGVKDSGILTKNREIFTITFLSNLVKTKGIFEFLKICHSLKLKGMKFKMMIIGKEVDVRYEEVLSNARDMGLQELICHSGPAYADEKLNLLSATSLLLFPTQYKNECYPLVLLEALQMGIPVVASNEGAISDIVIDGVNGYIVDTVKLDISIQKVVGLMTDKQLYTHMSNNARKLFLEKNTIEKFEINLVNTLKEIVKNEEL